MSSYIWKFFAALLTLQCFPLTGLQAAIHSVRAGGGGTFTTIQACANAAVAGDTCLVFAGTYNERVTPANSGTAANPITFQAADGAAVKFQGFNLTNRSHIIVGGPTRASGFELTGGNQPLILLNNTAHVIIRNNYIHHPGSGVCIRCAFNSTSSFITIEYNTVEWCGNPPLQPAEAIQLRGDHFLVQDNILAHVPDFITAYGVSDLVVRRNTFGPMSDRDFPGTTNQLHVDGLQSFCLSGLPSARILVESNTMSDVDVVDSHFALFSGDKTPLCGNHVIVRYNLIKHVGGPYVIISQRNAYENVKLYNNTLAHIGLRLKGNSTFNFQQSPQGAVINNSFYLFSNDGSGGYGLDSGSQAGFLGKNNLAFNACGTNCTWRSPISTESGGVRNQDPLFVSSTDYRLQSNSPARAAGTHLTTVAAADAGSGTKLIVEDSAFFQDGMGLVAADWISVGATNAVQIASIDYATNTISLVNPIDRTVGSAVFLYKDSSATIMLPGTIPDIGAFQGVFTNSGPSPASNLTAIPR